MSWEDVATMVALLVLFCLLVTFSLCRAAAQREETAWRIEASRLAPRDAAHAEHASGVSGA